MASIILKIMREAKGISQGRLAHLLKIDRSAIAHYEAGELSAISKDKIAEAGRYLDINPAYIMSVDPNPFKSQDPNGVIRLFIKGDNLSADIASLLAIAKYGFVNKLVFLTASPSSLKARFRKIVSGMATVYAIAMIDIADNIFLFRHKDQNRFIGYLQNLVYAIKTAENASIGNMIIENEPLPDELMHRIQNDSAEKSDLSMCFNYRYTLDCRRGIHAGPNGQTRFFIEPPLHIIRNHINEYFKHEKDISRLKVMLREMVRTGLDAEDRSLIADAKEYKKRLEAAFKAWDIPYSDEELFK